MKTTIRNVLGLALILTCFFSTAPASAGTVTITKYYEAPGADWIRRTREDATCKTAPPCRLAKDGQVEAGGVYFNPVGGKARKLTMTIRVVDDVEATGKVSVGICEDTNQSSSCGTDDRIWKNTCLGANDKFVLSGVSSSNAVIVTVQAVYSCTQFVNDLPDEQMVGTSGKISMSYKK